MITKWNSVITLFWLFLLLSILTLYPLSWYQIDPVQSNNDMGSFHNLRLSQRSNNLIFYLPLDQRHTSQGRENFVLDEVNELPGDVESGKLEPGVLNSGIRFTEETGRIAFDDHPVFDFVSNDFTINLWINLDAVSGNSAIGLLSQSDGPGARPKWMFTMIQEMGFSSLFRLNFNGWDNTLMEVKILESGPIAFRANSWQFISLVRNQDLFHFYVNGSSLGIDAWSFDMSLSDGQMSIGYLDTIDGNLFAVDGIIDEISIFNTDLIQSDIQKIYQQNLDQILSKLRFAIDIPPLFLGMLVAVTISMFAGMVLFNRKKK